MSQEKINKLPRFDGNDLIVIRLCAITFIAWTGLLSYKYFFFGYTDWDLALYSQVMWNLCHHSLHNSLFGMNFLANHAEYISFFIIPIYFIDPHPLTLVFLKVFSFVSGAYILYLLAKRVLPAAFAIFFTFLYLIFPANIYAMLHEFHFETLSIGLLFLLFYFYRAQKFIPFCLTMFFVGIIKENMPPIIVAFGIYSLFAKGRSKIKWSVIPILFGLGLFYLSLFVIMPALRTELGSSNQYIGLYSQVGGSFHDIAANLLLHPEKLIKIIAQPHNVLYLHDLFSPLIYLSFLSPHILFLISPVLLQNLLSSTASQQTIFFHYSATIVPFIFLSALESLGTIARKRNAIFFGVVFCALVVTCLSNTGFYLNDIFDRISLIKDPLDNVRWQMIEKIPPDKGVIATFRFLPALSQRKNVYSYFNVLEGRDGLAFNKPFRLPEEISYALIDFGDDWIRDKLLVSPDSGLQNIQDFLSHGWKIKDAVEDIVLFERAPAMTNELVRRSNTPFLPQNSDDQMIIDNRFRLQSFELGQNNFGRQDILPFIFYWKVDHDIDESYAMKMVFKKRGRIMASKVRRIGYTFYPTFTWKKDHYFKEQYWFRHPGLEAGKYTLEISFCRIFYELTQNKEFVQARYHPVDFTYVSRSAKTNDPEKEKKRGHHVFPIDIMITK